MKIKNRKNQSISLHVEEESNPKGLAFVMHGLGSFSAKPHIQAFSKAFQDNGYTVVTFDTTNSFGESDGKYEDATTTNYYEDLVDVVAWSKEQAWYQEPFVLVGHSLGGICVGLYAEDNPKDVKGLVLVSTVVSGVLSYQAHEEKGEIEEWKRTGWFIRPHNSLPGVMRKLPWSHMKDRMKYDLLEKVEKLTMPVLVMVGGKDDTTPLKHQQILYEQLPGKRQLHVLKGAEHSIKDNQHFNEVKEVLGEWINKVLT